MILGTVQENTRNGTANVKPANGRQDSLKLKRLRLRQED